MVNSSEVPAKMLCVCELSLTLPGDIFCDGERAKKGHLLNFKFKYNVYSIFDTPFWRYFLSKTKTHVADREM